MELSDEVRINASREIVYEALTDLDILQQCIPGCEELIRQSNTKLEEKGVLKIGPVTARFSGIIELN